MKGEVIIIKTIVKLIDMIVRRIINRINHNDLIEAFIASK